MIGELSVLVPARDEGLTIGPLLAELSRTLAALPAVTGHEVLVIDDGSHDDTAQRAVEAGARVIRHQGSYGQSQAILSGLIEARGELVLTMDGDGQNPPSEVGRLVACFEGLDWRRERLGLVIGQRVPRRDGALRRASASLANVVRRLVLPDDGVPDSGCGMMLLPRELFLRLPYFDHRHRFMPTLVRREGYQVRSVTIDHRPRAHGRSKVRTLDRLVHGVVDLAGVAWLLRRKQGVRFR